MAIDIENEELVGDSWRSQMPSIEDMEKRSAPHVSGCICEECESFSMLLSSVMLTYYAWSKTSGSGMNDLHRTNPMGGMKA